MESSKPTLGSIQYIKGVGPKLATLLAKLHIYTPHDFLMYFPKRYEDRRKLLALNSLPFEGVQLAFGQLIHIKDVSTKTGKCIIHGWITDGHHTLQLIWFNQKFLLKTLKKDTWVLARGKLERSPYSGQVVLHVQEHEVGDYPTPGLSLGIGSIVPVYPLTAGLPQWKMRQLAILLLTPDYLPATDPLPEMLRKKIGLLSLKEALQSIHFPKDAKAYSAAKKRLIFDDFFYFQVLLRLKKNQRKRLSNSPIFQPNHHLRTRYLAQLPYSLTDDQKRVIQEIDHDLARPVSMNRLLQGDVGSGKTDVAICSLLSAIECQKKAIIMAPTEILAEQHFLKLMTYLEPLGIEVVLLKGGLSQKTKKSYLQKIQSDIPLVIIGTHALIQDSLTIPNVGLVIIDEQHRFGTIQRTRLQQKGQQPHCLFMSATPIPRSFMLTCFGDLDKSIIYKLPPGRKPPFTQFVPETQLSDIYTHCHTQLAHGHQIYLVYPLIEESEKLDLKSAIDSHLYLQTHIFPTYTVGIIHGKLTSIEKKEIMAQFKEQKIQILVATTVIEVGIDVPNATTMVIHHAERFGLSQLHQLRGRIGRGHSDSFCFLVAKPRANTYNSRIKAILNTSDGFKLAEDDLQIRGAGDMLGTRQSGIPDFGLADLAKDESTLLLARQEAVSLLKMDPYLLLIQHHTIMQHMLQLYPDVQAFLN